MGNSEQKSKSTKTPLVVGTTILAIASGAFYLRAKQGHEVLPAKTATSAQQLTLLHLEPFVLNLADNDRAYLRIGIDLGVIAPSGEEEKSGKAEYSLVIARDTILGVLSTRRTQDLVTAEDKQRLKKDLKEALTSRAPEVGVREVYFTEFLLQR